MKSRIIERIGAADVLLPSRIAAGLAANDRAKVRMSALQAAARQAGNPATPADDLSSECRAAGIEAAGINALVAQARSGAGGVVATPGLANLLDALSADIAAMIDAVAAGDPSVGGTARDRLEAMKPRFAVGGDEIPASRISELTAVPASGADSVHRLVMDLHKALNRVSAACSEEIVAGALAHGLQAGDRPIVEAFMRGLDRTRALKFDHPGLDTTATRSGSRLIVQNDIGTTDAHVLVITVEALAVTVTYTDVHHARAKFFVGLFDAFPVQWSGLDREKAEGLGDDGVFYLITGRFQAEAAERRDAFLEAIGAMLVFLIDWNKARKSLRLLIDGASAVRIVDWGARHRIGHRGFLECGGADLVASAVRHAASTRIGYGEQLAAVMGRDIAVEFLKAILRIAMEGLRDGRSVRLIRDAIETELVGHLDRTDSAMLAIVVRQAGLARDIAAGIASHIDDWRFGRACRVSDLADRARRIEEKADRIAVDARASARRFGASPTIARIIDAAEETIDELEQAAFLASLAPATIDAAMLEALATLAAAAIAGAEATAAGVDAAIEVPEGRRRDLDDAFDATRRLSDIEHRADDAERTVTALVLGKGGAPGGSCILELARAIERATDRMARIGHLLHEHVMADLSA
jgi:uncharacterized protein Yka (UPF0111/DUF47 family)